VYNRVLGIMGRIPLHLEIMVKTFQGGLYVRDNLKLRKQKELPERRQRNLVIN